MPSATAAAEPLDDPPGVCAGLCGFLVRGGIEISIRGRMRLPQDNRARLFEPSDQSRVSHRHAPFVNRRSPLGRHARSVVDIFHPERDAVQRAPRAARSKFLGELPRLFGELRCRPGSTKPARPPRARGCVQGIVQQPPAECIGPLRLSG